MSYRANDFPNAPNPDNFYQDEAFGYRDDMTPLFSDKLFPSQGSPEDPEIDFALPDPQGAEFQFIQNTEVPYSQSVGETLESVAGKDKKNMTKRNRASGEILEYLIAEFAKNPSPSNVVRKAISTKTGMNERSVRIWFQNRRAKTKKMEKLNGTGEVSQHGSFSGAGSANNWPDEAFARRANSVPGSAAAVAAERLPIEINEKYCFVACNSLSVGTWQRLKSGYLNDAALKDLHNLSPRVLNTLMMTTDLLIILSRKDNELNYFFSGVFQNEKVLFRIYFPLLSIVSCVLLNNQRPQIREDDINPLDAQLRLEVNRPPRFAVHFFKDPNSSEENPNQWSICEDFSEGQQVVSAHVGEGGKGIPHMLSGSLGYLRFLNNAILAFHEHAAAQVSVPKDQGGQGEPGMLTDQDTDLTNLDAAVMGGNNPFMTPVDFSTVGSLAGFGNQFPDPEAKADMAFFEAAEEERNAPDVDLGLDADPLYEFNGTPKTYLI
ncbi:unnamed protein product [Kuraishia capsulata CBS 1993]|uniref:Homeobox domain-containing protein n=1 Tax=Kuraishia capsulata CBS 1993 TaxID=1382522 RepID=W6MLU1_9ASCO|nr:uncharacterized protein KUCA_T00003449001 [Kuraishia capsulata CBS 1993]CDK27471.1 unnamed protein product [Kuraishia capsulata CBS 1993]